MPIIERSKVKDISAYQSIQTIINKYLPRDTPMRSHRLRSIAYNNDVKRVKSGANKKSVYYIYNVEEVLEVLNERFPNEMYRRLPVNEGDEVDIPYVTMFPEEGILGRAVVLEVLNGSRNRDHVYRLYRCKIRFLDGPMKHKKDIRIIHVPKS